MAGRLKVTLTVGGAFDGTHEIINTEEGRGFNDSFASPEEFAEWVHDQVLEREALFPENVEGSGGILPVDTGGGAITVDEIRYQMFRIRFNDGRTILRQFRRATGIPLLAPEGQEGVYHYTPMGRGNRLRGYRAGEEPLRVEVDYGIIRVLKSRLVNPSQLLLEELADTDERYPVMEYDDGVVVVNTPAAYCAFLSTMSCFMLTFILRWLDGWKADKMRKLCELGKELKYSTSRPRKISDIAPGRLISEFMKVVAESLGVPFTAAVCSMAATERTFLDVCTRFGLVGVLSDVSAEAAMHDVLLFKGCIPSGLFKNSDVGGRRKMVDAIHRGSCRVYCKDNWKGMHEPYSKRNNLFVFVGFNLNDAIAHVEPVLNAFVEMTMARCAVKGTVRTVVYDGEEVNTVLSLTDMEPKIATVYDTRMSKEVVESLMFRPSREECILATPESIVTFIEEFGDKCMEAFEAHRVYKDARSALDEYNDSIPKDERDKDKEDAALRELGNTFMGSVPFPIGADVIVDSSALQTYAEANGKEYRNTSGMVYMCANLFYESLEYTVNDGKLTDLIHFGEFRSAMIPSVMRRVCTRDIETKISTGEYGASTIAEITCKDISSFSPMTIHKKEFAPVDGDNPWFVFGVLANIRTMSVQSKEIAEALVDGVVTESKTIILEKVVAAEIAKMEEEQGGKALESTEVNRVMADAKAGRILVNEKRQLYRKMNTRALASAFTLSGVHTLLMNTDPEHTVARLVKLGTFTHPKMALMNATDRQLFEPPIPCRIDVNKLTAANEMPVDDALLNEAGFLHRLQDKQAIPDGYMEIDANIFYSTVRSGEYDGALPHDFTGGEWFTSALDLPSVQTISYVGNDYLWHYKGDWGYVLVHDVDWHTLQKDWPKVFTLLSPWYRYQKDTLDGVGTRFVLVNLVIATCLWAVEAEWLGRVINGIAPACPTEEERRDTFIRIQRDCFGISRGLFNLTPDQREAVHCSIQAGSYNPASNPRVGRTVSSKGVVSQDNFESLHLEGILPNKDKIVFKEKKAVCTNYSKLVEIATDHARHEIGGGDKGIYKHVKSDMNSCIGSMKPSGLSITSTSGLKRLSASRTIRFNDTQEAIAMSSKQIHAVQLPGRRGIEESEQYTLLQSVHVDPISQDGAFSCLRNDILTKSSFIISKGGSKCNAFGAKTDAWFCEIYDEHGNSNTDKLLDWIEEIQGPSHPKYPRMDAITTHANECIQNNCTDFYGCDHCGQQKPWECNEYGYPLFRGLKDIPLVKMIFHPAKSVRKTDASDESTVFNKILDVRNTMNELEFKRDDITMDDRQITADGHRMVGTFANTTTPADNLSNFEIVGQTVLASSLLPNIYEDGCIGIVRQVRVDEPLTVIDPELSPGLTEHFILFVGGTVVSESHTYTFDPAGGKVAYYDAYERKVCDLIIELKRVRLEGAPGSGKSTILKRVLKMLAEVEGMGVFATTSTHSSLAQLIPLGKIENVFVSTLYSFLGVYKNLAGASTNAKQWLGPDVKRGLDGTAITCGTGDFRAYYKRFEERTFVLDEYEMCPKSCEKMLTYLSQMSNMIIVGDMYQTAAIGDGIRCNGTAMNIMTSGNTIEFNVPFRCADKEVYKARRTATRTDCRLYLSDLLTDYSKVERGLLSQEVKDMCQVIADGWREASTGQFDEEGNAKRKIFTDSAVCVQNHKGVVVMNSLVMDAYVGAYDGILPVKLTFTGTDAKQGKPETNDDAADVEDENTDDYVPTDTQKKWAEKNYVNAFYHHTGTGTSPYLDRFTNPAGNPNKNGFYVGTRFELYPNHTYKVMSAFLPSVCATIPAKRKVSQGTLLVYTGTRREDVRRLLYRNAMTEEQRLEEKRVMKEKEPKELDRETLGIWHVPYKVKQVRVYSFRDAADQEILMTKEAVQARIYYPFAGYSGAMVGHTYNRFYIANLYKPGKCTYYPVMKDILDDAYDKMGPIARVSKFVRQMNVNTSRVTTGNRTAAYDLRVKDASFWKPYLKSQRHHIASGGENKQVDMLKTCHASVLKADDKYTTIYDAGFITVQRGGKRKRK
jgi:hypothetical protein